MSPDVLLYLITAAIVVSALALLLQTLFMYGMYRSSRITREQMTAIAEHVQAFVTSAQSTFEQTRRQLSELAAKSSSALDLASKQLLRMDEVLQEATSRARIQMDRIELMLDDTLGRIQEITNLLHKGILRPVREINGLAAGLQAALGVLFRGRRVSVERATQDEEMFI